jgi:hypothetical protein
MVKMAIIMKKYIYKFSVILSFFLLIFFLSQCSYLQETQQQRDKVYNDLKTLCESLPTPDGLRKTGTQDLIKPDRGSFTMNFKTNLDCKSAGLPYYEYLASKGWQPTAEGSRYFYKENYIINVSCNYNVSQSVETTVQVSCGWDAYGEKKNIFK